MLLNQLKGTFLKPLWRARVKMFNWMFLSVQKNIHIVFLPKGKNSCHGILFCAKVRNEVIVFVLEVGKNASVDNKSNMQN